MKPCSKIDQMDKNLGGKMDRMLQKQDEVLLEVKDIAQNGNELLVEVKDMNRKIDKVRDNEIIEMKRRRRTPLQAGGACEAPPHEGGTISI